MYKILFVSTFRRHYVINSHGLKLWSIRSATHLPLAWRKKEENALSETLYTVCLQ